jgi:Uma2 family endonuclease
MARETLAPWAERVPNRGPLAADELLRLPADGWRYELVDGVLVRMPPPGFDHGELVMNLGGELRDFVRPRNLGTVTGAETGFLLSRPDLPDTVLAPDVAFVRANRVPPRGAPERRGYLRLAPDLVAEVASPDQYKPEMAAKARVYIEAGVRLVWIVWPSTQTVDVWRPGSDAPTATLTLADALDGFDVLPGFTYPLAALLA